MNLGGEFAPLALGDRCPCSQRCYLQMQVHVVDNELNDVIGVHFVF